MDISNKVQDYVDKNREKIANLLSELINFRSITGQEGEVVNRVKKEMEALGYDEVFTDAIGNVVGRIGSGSKTILYDAHLDVVEAEKSGWESDPFSGVIREGKIFGRGAVDDKGPFVCILFAGKIIKDLNLDANNEFTIYVSGSVSEEECEGLALKSLLTEYPQIKTDYVIIAEPSELNICRGHRGRAQIEAIFPGEPVHASIHEQGINPIEIALPFIGSVQQLDEELKERVEAKLSLLGHGDVVVTSIICKNNSFNTLPSETKVIIDRRMIIGDTEETILKELESLPNGDRANIKYSEYKAASYNGYQKVGKEYFPACVLEEDHKLIEAAIRAYTELFKDTPVVKMWGFSTNATYTMGEAKVPSLGFGPGLEKLCHGNNEYVSIDDLLKATKFYAYLPVVLSEKK
ncbi:MAG TPA: YgeY family selenium metabolism-linked hydrolase [Candidatus Atribacteria bacterium]|uniref:M20/DapE family protein YgeY n=1 Tax=candidate division TA06 bacterium 34_109 TaxID=1635277 RepID=A0A101I051_UNCT6|nr:MAG: M20/DapE family protein YgeY [candidate division TA06 bacterium 34_109]HBY58023.1 YgeY family selenium metabolism-linked hydrolase [Candidatus Atribacteria bacterium]